MAQFESWALSSICSKIFLLSTDMFPQKVFILMNLPRRQFCWKRCYRVCVHLHGNSGFWFPCWHFFCVSNSRTHCCRNYSIWPQSWDAPELPFALQKSKFFSRRAWGVLLKSFQMQGDSPRECPEKLVNWVKGTVPSLQLCMLVQNLLELLFSKLHTETKTVFRRFTSRY